MRFQSVSDFFVVDLFFILQRLSDGYYSDNFVGLRMSNSHDRSVQDAKSQKTNLAVIEPIIQKSQRVACENLFDFRKVEPVALEIGPTLRFVPLESHDKCSYTL
jgi:hypothetical protein